MLPRKWIIYWIVHNITPIILIGLKKADLKDKKKRLYFTLKTG
ncbi:MAG: hypothetical protein ACFFD8_08100 [Candidatus Thorarchaeota archaeon]